eukprot:PITA_29867
MDVKSAFLNGDLEEEVYIEQPDGFILGNDPNLVCRLKKALYGLKQAPRAWYYRLDKYLHQQDDIIFGSNEEDMSQRFALVMQKEFEMSLLGELTYSLVLQIQQKEGGIFLSQTKYPTGHHACSRNSWSISGKSKGDSSSGSEENFKYLQGTQNYGLWYPRDTDLTLHAYTDADWAGSLDDRKSTSGGAFFMGSRLVSWFSKKQSSIALSTAEAEYVAAASCCTQLLWMMQTLQDFQITFTPPISILCDNISEINISKNLVMHSKTKHIPIKYHFLLEQVLEQKVKLEYVPSKEQVADILTKPLPRETLNTSGKSWGLLMHHLIVETLLNCWL